MGQVLQGPISHREDVAFDPEGSGSRGGCGQRKEKSDLGVHRCPLAAVKGQAACG